MQLAEDPEPMCLGNSHHLICTLRCAPDTKYGIAAG